MSKKLRALMQLVPVEPPAAGLAAPFPREPAQLGDVPFGVVAAREPLEVLAHELQDYLHRVKSHPELFTVTVPIGNGEEIALKLG